MRSLFVRWPTEWDLVDAIAEMHPAGGESCRCAGNKAYRHHLRSFTRSRGMEKKSTRAYSDILVMLNPPETKKTSGRWLLKVSCYPTTKESILLQHQTRSRCNSMVLWRALALDYHTLSISDKNDRKSACDIHRLVETSSRVHGADKQGDILPNPERINKRSVCHSSRWAANMKCTIAPKNRARFATAWP